MSISPTQCGLFSLLFLGSLAFADEPIQQLRGKPNVLFIAVDDMRCDLGCYGVKQVQSPNIDKLAASGVIFTRAYCQQAVCNPSRASVMTGLRPDSTRVWDLVTDLRTVNPNALTIPQHFRKHGYRALGYGKIFHNTFPDNVSWDEPHEFPMAKTWSKEAREKLVKFKASMRAAGKPDAAIQRMRGPATEAVDDEDQEQLDGAICEQALGAMRKLASEKQPFFLACGFIRPHLPFIAPRKYWDLYDRKKIPLAANGYFPKGAPAVAFGDSGGGFYELRDYMDYAEAPWPKNGPLTEAQQRELKHGYYAAISYADALIGRLLAELDQLKLADKTIVVFWSDHGWKLGEHGGWCKQTNYEIDTRVPMIIRAPGAAGNGKSANGLVEFVDLFPTLCELSGLPVPEKLEGKSLQPLLLNPTATVKEAAFSQFPHKDNNEWSMGYAMRTDRYRYIEWLDRETGKLGKRELYDHEKDPEENQNLAGDPNKAELLNELSGQLWKTLPRPKKG